MFEGGRGYGHPGVSDRIEVLDELGSAAAVLARSRLVLSAVRAVVVPVVGLGRPGAQDDPGQT